MSIFKHLEKYLKREKPYHMKPDGTKMTKPSGHDGMPKMGKISIGTGTKLSKLGHGTKAFKVPKY